MINAKIIVLIIPKAILLLKFLPNVIKYVLITLAGPSVEKSFKTSINITLIIPHNMAYSSAKSCKNRHNQKNSN